jgi:hypothetical protein
MEAVVYKSLGDVFFGDTVLLEVVAVKDDLVGNSPSLF